MAGKIVSKLVMPPAGLCGINGRYFTALYSGASRYNRLGSAERELRQEAGLYRLGPKQNLAHQWQQCRHFSTTQSLGFKLSLLRLVKQNVLNEPQLAESPVVPDVRNLDRIISNFEDRCQRNEMVAEKEFVKTFALFTRVVDQMVEAGLSNANEMSQVIQYSALLLRCCGSLMFEVPPKGREILAGNLWTYLKERGVPLDISHYNSLIRVMNENGTIYDPQKILDEIKERGLQQDRVTYQRLIHQHCLQGNIAGATSMLETMKDEGVELKEAIFASLIIGYNKQEKPPAISEMFDLMRSNNIEPGSKSYVSALISQAERFARDPDGASAELVNIMEMLEKDEIQFSVHDHVDLISHLGPLRDSHAAVAGFFDRYLTKLYGSVNARYRIISSLLRANQTSFASHLFWDQDTKKKAIQAGNIGTYYVRALAKNHNVSAEFAVEECLKLHEMQWNLKAMSILYYTAAEAGNLNVVRLSMRKIIEQEPMKAIYTWPLIAQAKDQSDIIKVLKEDLNPRLDTTDLLETFSQWIWPRFAEDVLKLFELNSKELKYDTNLLIASFLSYSVQENRIDEAVKFISEIPQELMQASAEQSSQVDEEGGDEAESQSQSQSRQQSNTGRGDLIATFLNQIVDQTKDPELVKKAFSMCKLPGQQLSLRSLNSLVRVHLVNDDFNGALDQFLNIAQEYRAVPSRNELMKHCLNKKDPESLQKIMNATSKIHGEHNSLYDLAICCLQSNKLKQAQKIFASPGFRVRPVRVYQSCRSIARSDDITMLENFVSLTRDMYDINQEFLYQMLIDTYDRTSNAARALNLWNMMQEEEFQPSKKSLIMIANLLEKHNIPVPFQKPRPLNAGGRAQQDENM